MNTHKSIPGLVNFRDLGGYPVVMPGNRKTTIRKGVLFRSGHLHEAGEEALQHMARLDVRLVIDFRTPRECEKRPSRLPAVPGIRTVQLPMNPGSAGGFADLMHNYLAAGKPVAAAQIKTAMAEVYTMLVLEHGEAYARFIGHLLERQPAVTVFHCASGKDRTGIAAAMLLALLGCDRQTIMNDYLLTNQMLDAEHQLSRAISDFGEHITELLDAEAIAALYGVDDAYLHAAFDAIEERWGNLDTWLQETIGITDAQRLRLREFYLEP